MQNRKPVLIYIHGFTSSPQSEKAQETVAWLAANRPDIKVVVPELSNYPDQAEQQLLTLLEQEQHNNVGLVGSSLGGLFSSWLSAAYYCKACLVNPAVYADARWAGYLGENTNMYTGQKFLLEQKHVDVIKRLGHYMPQPEKIMVLLQTGDETLDYRDAEEKYQGATVTIETGGNHRFEGYKNHLPNIVSFLEL